MKRITHTSKVLVPGSDPEGPVGASVSQDHALRYRVAVDKSFISLLLKARGVPAPLHHLDGHLSYCKLIPVSHLRRLMGETLIKKWLCCFSIQNHYRTMYWPTLFYQNSENYWADNISSFSHGDISCVFINLENISFVS